MVKVTNPKQLPEHFRLLKRLEDAQILKEKLTMYKFGDVYVYQKGKWSILALEVLP